MNAEKRRKHGGDRLQKRRENGGKNIEQIDFRKTGNVGERTSRREYKD